MRWSNAAQMAWMTAYARAFQTSCWGRSTRRPALSEPIKLPSEAHIQRWALVSCLGRLWRPASHPTSPFFCGNCAHFIKYALASVQMRVKAVRDAESSPGGCSANTLDITTAERARAPPQPLLMVAKCSVMMGGQLVSRRRLFGCSGPKSGSAGSSWRPQLTQISAAPQTLTHVLQDKPRHSTDLAELCSLILWSALFSFRS